MVNSYALSGTSLKNHINYFLFCLENFNIISICGDYNGGVEFLQACNESDLFKQKNIKLQTIEVGLDKPEEYQRDLQAYKNHHRLKF